MTNFAIKVEKLSNTLGLVSKIRFKRLFGKISSIVKPIENFRKIGPIKKLIKIVMKKRFWVSVNISMEFKQGR